MWNSSLQLHFTCELFIWLGVYLDLALVERISKEKVI